MSASTKTRHIVAVITVLLVLLGLTSTALAFEGRSGDDVVIPADEVVDGDLYVTAGTFTLDGTIKGDLVVTGGEIIINGTVEEDLLAVGPSIIIHGAVLDDVRWTGAALTMNSGGSVGDDLIGAGYSMEMDKGSTVGGDLLFAGFQALLAGDVSGDADVSANSVDLTGTVGGDADIDVGSAEGAPPFNPFMFMPNAPQIPTVSPGLTIGDNAQVGGEFNYSSPVEADVPAGIDADHEAVSEAPEAAGPTILDHILDAIRSFVSLAIVGLLLLWLLPTFTKGLTDAIETRTLGSLGRGILAVLAFMIGLPLLMVVIGIVAAIFGLLTLANLVALVILLGIFLVFTLIVTFIVMFAWVAKIAVSVWLGRLIFQRTSAGLAEHRFWPFFVGLVIVVILAAIPYLGGLVNILVALFGFGALWLWGQHRLGVSDEAEPE